jgi:UPF0755 protein
VSSFRCFSRLGAGILLLFCWVAPLRLAQFIHSPVPGPAARIEIPLGAGPNGIARAVADAGLTNWPQGVRWGLRFWGRAGAVKAGVYAFSPGTRILDLFADFAAGRVELIRVTLPEGITAREMGKILETVGVIRAAEFVDAAYDPDAPQRWGLAGPSLEGYLFPDTYRFARGLDAFHVIGVLVRRFREVAEPLFSEARERGLDLLQWVTLASLVEKETGDPAEKPKVAAVFLNRLSRGMRLESDPTVIYGLLDFDGNLRREDLARDTPYNTYTRGGFPAGPIANPGRSSLEAVARPARVPYLFFVSRNDGTHVFSVTYEQHRKAVNRYQREVSR